MSSIANIESKAEGATLAMMSGNLPKAERICREVLALHPEAMRAHLLLGIVLQRTQRNGEATEHLKRAHELDPSSFDAASCLAAAYRMSGELRLAAHFAEMAVRLKPNDPHAQTELGTICLEVLRLQEAEEHLRKAFDLTGGAPDVVFALGQCLERRGRPEEAAHMVRAGLSGRQMSVDDLLKFMSFMARQLCPACAAEAAAAAYRLAPELLRTRAFMVRSLLDARREAEALTILDDPSLPACVAEQGQDTDALSTLGMALQSFGRVEEARAYLRFAVEAPNPVGSAFYTYTHVKRVSSEDAGIVRALEQRVSSPLPYDDMARLHFALGKAYEDLGEYERAMEQFDAANGDLEQPVADRAGVSSPSLAMFTPQLFESNPGKGCDSELPIFVVGVIRSGTTLSEQILSSHPRIGGAGEVTFWNYNAPDLIDSDALTVRSDRLREAGEQYVRLLKSAGPGKARVVDKMPANFRSLGLLHLALPNSRIIHMRRSPVDTCLSIYSTYSLAQGDLGRSKRSLVDMYRVYQETMSYWRSVLPAGQLLEVDYESLVSDSEPTIRRMIDFVGLEWDEACLHPEDNLHGVSTPSLWQVRRPINKSSVERWRRFEPWLGELRELLPASD